MDYLSKQLDPDGEEKTLIFAANTMHADMLIALLKAQYHVFYHNAIMKITGAPDTDDPRSKIRRFKNQRYPNIALTVDLLTTGIDVPEILRSYSKGASVPGFYMSKCWDARQDCATGLARTTSTSTMPWGCMTRLKDYTQMQPVVANPQTTISGLVNELERIKDAGEKQRHVETILSKIQRKKRTISERNVENFAVKSNGKSISEFVQENSRSWILISRSIS